MSLKLPTPEPDHGHPSVERRDVYPDDRLLRLHGFAIYSRRKDREPCWIHKGKVYRQSEALDMVLAANS